MNSEKVTNLHPTYQYLGWVAEARKRIADFGRPVSNQEYNETFVQPVNSKPVLLERFEVGVRYLLAQTWNKSSGYASKIREESLNKFEEAWQRGDNQHLLSKKGRHINSVETYGHLIAHCILRKLEDEDHNTHSDKASREVRLNWVKRDMGDVRYLEELLAAIKDTHRVPLPTFLGKIRYIKSRITKMKNRWGFTDADLNAHKGQLLSVYPCWSTCTAEEKAILVRLFSRDPKMPIRLEYLVQMAGTKRVWEEVIQ